MLSKVFKAALMAVTVIAVGATSGTAAPKLEDGKTIIMGRAGSYFGQVTDNNEQAAGEDAVSYLQNSNEMNLRFITLQGAFLGYMELEARGEVSGGTMASGKNMQTIMTFIQFMPHRNFDMTFGSLADNEYSSFAVGSGLATQDGMPTYKAWAVSLYTEGDGLRFRYKNPNFRIGGSLYTMSAGSANGFGDGTASNVFAGGKLGSLEYRASVINETSMDDQSLTSDDDKKTESKSRFVGLRYNITENMSISVDNYASDIEYMKDLVNTNSSSALQFRMKKVGPGNVVVTYGKTTHENDYNPVLTGAELGAMGAGTAGTDVLMEAGKAVTMDASANSDQMPSAMVHKIEVTDTALVYEIPMSKSDSRLQVFYMSKNIKASDPATTLGGAVELGKEFERKQTMIGMGVWLNF